MNLSIPVFQPSYAVMNRHFNSVSAFNANNKFNNENIFNKLSQDIDRFERKTKSNAEQVALYALSPIPTARRLGSLPDTVEDKNWSRAGLLVGMAAANFPGDFREMKLAFNEGKNIFATKTLPKNLYQHPLSFLRGTFLEPLGRKYTWLNKADNTLYNTRFGQLTKKIFNVKVADVDMIKCSKNAKAMYGHNFGGSAISKIAGRSLLRIPILGLLASAVLEIPAIINRTYATNSKTS